MHFHHSSNSNSKISTSICRRQHNFSILVVATYLFFGLTNAFSPSLFSNRIHHQTQKVSSSTTSSTTLKMANVSGSFFNPVPENNDDKNNDDDDSSKKGITDGEKADDSTDASANIDSFDASLANLMSKRKKNPLASTPSTIKGIPTSKATGFGKQSIAKKGPQIINTSKGSPSQKAQIINTAGKSKPLNDVNNPEYDDQGYTLYANEETGEKQRVFEALIDYPCEFKMKIIGKNEGAFAKEMVQVVADSCNVQSDVVKFTERVNGKWLSITVFAPVENAEMLYALYENVDRDPRVKFKF